MTRPTIPIRDRIVRQTTISGDCLIWTGKMKKGQPYITGPNTNPARILMNVDNPKHRVRNCCPDNNPRCIAPDHHQVHYPTVIASDLRSMTTREGNCLIWNGPMRHKRPFIQAFGNFPGGNPARILKQVIHPLHFLRLDCPMHNKRCIEPRHQKVHVAQHRKFSDLPPTPPWIDPNDESGLTEQELSEFPDVLKQHQDGDYPLDEIQMYYSEAFYQKILRER